MGNVFEDLQDVGCLVLLHLRVDFFFINPVYFPCCNSLILCSYWWISVKMCRLCQHRDSYMQDLNLAQ